MCVKIVKREYEFQGNLRFPEEVIMTCSEKEAKRLLEMVYRGDSFTKYTIEEI